MGKTDLSKQCRLRSDAAECLHFCFPEVTDTRRGSKIDLFKYLDKNDVFVVFFIWVLRPFQEKTRQSAQWGTYTPDQRYRQFLTSTKYVALTLEMAGWMNSMLIAISPKPLGRRITKFNKRSCWYSYINLDAIFFFYFYMIFLSL